MSERTLEQVRQEHDQLCFETGVLTYRMKIQQMEIDQKGERIKELNQEAAQIQQAEADKKKESENSNAETAVVNEPTSKELEQANG